MAIREQQIDVGALSLHVTMAGDPKDPAVLLLHGFPQSSRLWKSYLEPLAAKGFHAIAPDMRGYGGSDKPHDVAAYATRHLIADQVGLIRATGHERAHVIAHDWGGVVAWHLAARHPEVVDRLLILNAPHPDRMREALRESPAQLRRSWYIFAFQLPALPERMLTRDGSMARIFYGTCKDKSAFPKDEVAEYQRAIEKPGAARGMLGYYRAAGRALGSRAERARLPVITSPTLVLWGAEDVSLGLELTERLEHRVKDLTLERVPGASHWVADERPALVLERASSFFA
ncbi:MAG: putative hydrolase, alpha/beta fold family [Myxococcaceae bacterium]|nr:putative hydrolase, alpha/beta fold family [Myxococcaceae bacterium]